MRNFKFMSFMLAMIACTFSFVSCSKDDEESGNFNTSQLVGTWEMSHVSGWYLEEDDNDNLVKVSVDMDVNENTLQEFYRKDFADYVRYQFTESTFTHYTMWNYGGSWEVGRTVPYTLNGSTIIINPKNKEEEQVKVLSISTNQLVLKIADEDMDMNVTFKKVN